MDLPKLSLIYLIITSHQHVHPYVFHLGLHPDLAAASSQPLPLAAFTHLHPPHLPSLLTGRLVVGRLRRRQTQDNSSSIQASWLEEHVKWGVIFTWRWDKLNLESGRLGWSHKTKLDWGSHNSRSAAKAWSEISKWHVLHCRFVESTTYRSIWLI